MKYLNDNDFTKCFMTNTQCYKWNHNNNFNMKVKGILWHSTGANNPNLKRYVQPSLNDSNYSHLMNKIGTNTMHNSWNQQDPGAGVSAFIGKFSDGSVGTIQTLPWNYRCWGCGNGVEVSCNNGWLQFEICEDSLNDSQYFTKCYQEAIEVSAFLCRKFNLNPLGTVSFYGREVPVILCHADSHKLGLGSNHGDVYNWFNKYNITMDNVRRDVYNLIKKQEDKEEEERKRKEEERKRKEEEERKRKEEEEENNMTQEKFTSLMNEYLANQAKQPNDNYAQDSLLWAQQNGLIQGDQYGNLAPKKFITRQEMLVILKRFFDKFLKK